MKIGGIFSDLLTREMKKGYLFEDACPLIGGYFEKLVQAAAPLNPGSGGCGYQC
jgi:hypothetical protein